MAEESGKTYVIWREGSSFRTRHFRKGDGRGPLSDTGFTKNYDWDQSNNHVVDDMAPEDIEFLKSLPEAQEFRITDGLPKSSQMRPEPPVTDAGGASPTDGDNGPAGSGGVGSAARNTTGGAARTTRA